MKSRAVDTTASNEDHARMRIYDGDLPPDQAHEELLSIERAQHNTTRRSLARALEALADVRTAIKKFDTMGNVSFFTESPVFEIRTGPNLEKSVRIFADGKVEGFDGAECVVVNRIPALVNQAYSSPIMRRTAE